MIIYPAIDLINGEVVRLHKGDFARKTTYGTDPVAVAKSYAEAGAEWLHLVDLDGAKDPANRQTGLISKIIAGSGLKVQTGGGIRSREDVAALIKECEKLSLEGATDLHSAIAKMNATPWINAEKNLDCFLLSDGAATWGERHILAIQKEFQKKVSKKNILFLIFLNF